MKVIYEIKHGVMVKRLVNGDEPLETVKKQKLSVNQEQLEFSETFIEEKQEDHGCGC